MKNFVFVVISLLLVFHCQGDRHSGMVGVEVKDAWIRMVPESAGVTGGYATIVNHGNENALVAVEADISDAVELHEMKESEGMMRMRKMEGGFLVGSHKTLKLTPGGNHIMFIGLKKALRENEEIPLVLIWKNGDRTEANFKVLLSLDSSDQGHKH